MMLWLLVLTVAAAQAANPLVPEQIKTIYEEGKEYIYNYESQVMSGMPLGSKIYSGLKVKGQIRLQKITIREMKMELRNPQLYKVNGAIQENDPTREMLPDEILVELLDKTSTDMKSKLVKPVQFSYMRGHVEDLITERDDSDWSINIKKAILSLLEINFNDRHSLSPDVDLTAATNKPKLYRVIEPSISGECETAYKLMQERSREGTPSMTITKVRNLNKCVEKLVLSQSLLNGRPCDKMSEVLTAQSGVRYSLLGSPDQYIIVSAVGESQYNIIPHVEKQGRLSTLANQTLMLMDTQPITDQIPDPSTPSPSEMTLTAKLPQPHPRKIHRTKQDQQEDVKMVKKALIGIDKLTEDKVQDEVTVLLRDLHRLMEKLDKTSLKTILEDLDKDHPNLPRARKALLDVLPVVGTDAAVDILLERVEKSTLSASSVPLSLMALGMLPQPDIPIVKRLTDFIEKNDVKPVNPLVKRTAYLSLASLGYKLIQRNATEVKDLKEQEKILKMLLDESNERVMRVKLGQKLDEIKNNIKQTKELYRTAKDEIVRIVEKLYKSSEEESRLLALKTMGGLRYPEFLDKILSIAEDKNSPVEHRLEAIISLKQLGKDIPTKIHRILLPIYYDRSEAEEVRGLAVLAAITMDLPRPDLEMVGRSLQDEPSDHISTLVSSVLTELSNFTSPCRCMKPMSINSSLALHYAKKPTPGLHLSKMIVKSSYNKDLEMGQIYEQVMLYSSRERMPRAAAMHLTAISQSSAVSVIQVGYKAKGLDGVLDKVMTDPDVSGVLGLVKKILYPTQPADKVTKTDQDIKDVKQKVDVKPRKPEPLSGHIFVKLFGQELIYFDLKSLLPEHRVKQKDSPSALLNTLKSKVDPTLPQVTAVIDLVNKMMKTQQTLVMPIYRASLPTEMGLPIQLLYKMTGMVKLHGDIKLTLDPNSSLKKSILSKFDADVDLKLSGVIGSKMDMMAEMKNLQSGVSIQSKISLNSPANMVINVDPDKSKILLKVKDQKMQELVHVEHKPIVVTRLLPELAVQYPSIPEETEITLLDGAEIKTMLYDVGETYFGRKMSVVSVRAVRRDNGLSLPSISGKQVLMMGYDPLGNKDEMHIQIQHVTEKVSVSSVRSETEHEEKRTWWPFAWMSASADSAPPPVAEEHDSTVNIPEESVKGFIDLENEDLTVDYLKRKFRKDTDILNSPHKCGLVIRIVDPDPNPKHEIQLSTLYQRDKTSTNYLYACELRRKPIPGEQKDWKLVTSVKVELPDKEVEPSDLLDNEYQHNIERQILETSSDPMEVLGSQLDLESHILTKKIQQKDPYMTRRIPSRLLDNILNHLLEKDVSGTCEDLKKLVQKQRKISKDITELKKQEIKPMHKDRYVELMKKSMEKSKSISQKALDKLNSIPHSKQRPEEAITVLSLVTSNTKISQQLKDIQQKLKPLLLHTEYTQLDKDRQEVMKIHQVLRDAQEKHSLEKQPSERTKATIEVTPDDRDVYRKLQILEKKLIKLKPEKKDAELEDKLTDILKVLDTVNEKLYDSLKVSTTVTKMIRMKIVEVLYYEKLTISPLKISLVSKPPTPEVLKVLQPSSAPKDVEVQHKLLKLKHQLKTESVKLIHRLLLSIDATEDQQNLVSLISLHGLQSLKSLQTLKLLQLTLLEKLDQLSHPDNTEQPSTSLSSIIEQIKDVPRVVHQELHVALEDEKRASTSPIAIRSLRILARQAHIIDKVKKLVEEKILTKVTSDKPNVDNKLKLLKDIRGLEEDLHHDIDTVKKSSLPTIEPEVPEPLTMLKKMVQLEAKQLKLQAMVRDVSECLDRPGKPSSDDQEVLRCKKLLYDAITQASHIQNKLELLSHPVEKQLQPVGDLLDMLLKKQKAHLHTIQHMEDKLRTKAQKDTSLLQPLQVLQQIKDKAHRNEVRVQSLKDEPKKSSPHLIPAVQQTDMKTLNKPFKMTMTVTYGRVEDPPKMMHILLLGKKSLDQLFWEKDQVLPHKQDALVRLYLQDKHGEDDRTATGYSQIKDELNLYRHLHLLASYEDSLPVGVRELSWKFHELLKLVYYRKVSMVMPDETNLPNTVDIKMDMSRDNKWVDMEVKTVYETTVLRNLEVPAYCPMIVSRHKPVPEQILKSVTGLRSSYQCEVSPDRVKTLLGTKYEVHRDLDQCERILAADCSSSDKLVIISSPNKQLLKILVPGHKVEVSVPHTSDVEVHIDGVERQLQDPIVIGSEIMVHKLSPRKVEVRLPSLAVSVVTDGTKHTIKVGKVSGLQLCGLCGDPVSSPVTDLVGPQQVPLHQHPDALLTTYLLPSSTCDVKKHQKQHNVPQIKKLAKLVEPVEKTLVHVQEKQGMTCFSKLPVKSCPSGSKPDSTKSVLVPFYCLRTQHPKVDNLLLLAKTQVLDNFRYRRTSISEYKREPTDCVKV